MPGKMGVDKFGNYRHIAVPSCDMKHVIKRVKGVEYIVGLKCKTCGSSANTAIAGTLFNCRKANETLMW